MESPRTRPGLARDGFAYPVIQLNGPMAKQSNDEWAFTDDIKDADWSRYAIYAPRIRELFNFDQDSDTRLSILAVRSILAYLP
ncbi:hypothetical protein FRC00_007501, partial [Tulasnella sp. 408]